MKFEFKTIESPIKDVLLKEKGSKFLGYAFPINSENELKNALNEIWEQHPKATHHCYAFRLGLNGENYRANDDGEPSGSAGLPIYNQLLANDLTNILLVVVRYYGGTKLGVSGLVKTYKESAKLTLEEAVFVTRELETELEVRFQFSQQNIIFTLLNKFDAKILDFQAENYCKIIAKIKKAQEENVVEQLQEMREVEVEIK